MYNNYWTLTPELNAKAFELFESDGYGTNGPDDTYGNFDAERIQALFDDFGGILENRGITLPDDFTPESVYTNEFIDESIGLYERGEQLRRHCQARLDAAQARIDKIVAGPDGKATSAVPFDAG